MISLNKKVMIIVLLVISSLLVGLVYSIIQINYLTNSLTLRSSRTLINQTYDLTPYSTHGSGFIASKAGYIIVSLNSNAPNITVTIKYTADGIEESFQTEDFAVLPIPPTDIKFTLTSLNTIENVTASLRVEYIF